LTPHSVSRVINVGDAGVMERSSTTGAVVRIGHRDVATAHGSGWAFTCEKVAVVIVSVVAVDVPVAEVGTQQLLQAGKCRGGDGRAIAIVFFF
jgi:hypothetical protein